MERSAVKMRVSTRRTYAVHSVFLTLQGEGFHAGKAAVFVRFVGCNVWSGDDKDRERDTAKGACAAFCDTEFRRPDKARGGGHFTAEELVGTVAAVWEGPGDPFVVFTGGEPSMQLDDGLLDAFYERFRGPYLAVETNGSHRLPKRLGWVTLSPKPPMPVVLRYADELKVLSCFDPLPWPGMVPVGELFIQPVDYTEADGGDPARTEQEYLKCVKFVKENPRWRLSFQTHKALNIL